MAKKKFTRTELETQVGELQEQINAQATIPSGDGTMDRYMKEINDINKKGRVDSNKIQVIEITDHKNISLWTKAGKRIGPLHPHNARKTFELFWNMKIQLSATQPTPEQIEAYKKTSEYKKIMEALARSRAIKDKSRKSGQMEKLTAAIARLTGVKPEEISNVFKAHDVKTLSDTHNLK